MKILKMSLLTIILFIMLTACVDRSPQNPPNNNIGQPPSYPEKVETMSYLSGSRGIVAVSNDGVYYYADRKRGIVKVTEKGEVTVLSSDKPERIHVSGDWIYYQITEGQPIMKELGGPFYKLSTDGKEKVVFMEPESLDYRFRLIQLINNWMYFQDKEGISRVNIISKTTELVFEGDYPAILGAKEEWLYLKDDGTFYKTYLDGSNKKLIYEIDKTVYQGNLDGEWIYFVTYENDSVEEKLFKISLDGLNLTTYEQWPYPDRPEWGGWSQMDIEPYNGWVYYMSRATTDGEFLRRLDSDFRYSEDVLEGKYLRFGIVDDWIFYSDKRIYEQDVYMMKVDKSEKIKLYTIEIEPGGGL